MLSHQAVSCKTNPGSHSEGDTVPAQVRATYGLSETRPQPAKASNSATIRLRVKGSFK